MTTLFQLSDISLVYRALPALKHINWKMNRNEQWAVLGPNGAGKTSLAQILSGQVSRFSGEYLRDDTLQSKGVAYVCFEQAKALCDRDKKLDDSEFRADANDPGTSVRSLILAGKTESEAFQTWTKRLNMGHILDRGLRYISTGEMRKTLLVSAILSRPALLILDSPLDGLDRQTQAAMREAIDELLRSELNIILLSRQIEDIPSGISHVLTLQDGEMICSGERDAVLDNTLTLEAMRPALPELAALPEPAPRPYQIPANQPLLELKNVAVSYGDLQVLHNVNWRFDHGEHCCISGPNGCGKTTLLSLITGDNHKAYGQDITLFGIRRGSGESVWEIKQKFGQIDTQLQLNFARGMKVVEVVISGLFDTIGLFDNWGDSHRQRAEDWLAALGVAGYSMHGYDALSFGLQRMVLLARAMVKSPAILILDEPTLGLDGFHRQLILRAIDHIAQNSDTQILFVSHSAGDQPHCINQQLTFLPGADHFDVVIEKS